MRRRHPGPMDGYASFVEASRPAHKRRNGLIHRLGAWLDPTRDPVTAECERVNSLPPEKRERHLRARGIDRY